MEREQLLRRLASEIYDLLGPGCLESHYHAAFKIGLQVHNIMFESEKILPVLYYGFATGQYLRMDIVVEQSVILEFKAVKKLSDDNKSQLERYMRISGVKSGILINFGGPEVEIWKKELPTTVCSET
jgi:GxxExxY protein